MKYFFPDSQDFVDPSFDFEHETRSKNRTRQRDDLYPHEMFEDPPYDGILVSKSIVDRGSIPAKYTISQRQRLLHNGVREFFRLDELDRRISTMGDCGAFSYLREEEPIWSVEEVIEFYEECRFDYGISVDHVIPVFKPELDSVISMPGLETAANPWQARQDLTLELAHEFVEKAKACAFEPIGVAQGWSPKSYARAVEQLEAMGFRLIALGGLVPLKTPEVIACLEAVSDVRSVDTQLHLLGITRFDRLRDFERFGVVSFDSTSPLKQAFKDARDNYHTLEGPAYPAIRVPQVDANPSLKRRIQAGEIDGRRAKELERACLEALREYDTGLIALDNVVQVLGAYEALYRGSKPSRLEEYESVLREMPWKKCDCSMCRDMGIHVLLFRGAERNRRRGFHNIRVAYFRLQPTECMSG